MTGSAHALRAHTSDEEGVIIAARWAHTGTDIHNGRSPDTPHHTTYSLCTRHPIPGLQYSVLLGGLEGDLQAGMCKLVKI